MPPHQPPPTKPQAAVELAEAEATPQLLGHAPAEESRQQTAWAALQQQLARVTAQQQQAQLLHAAQQQQLAQAALQQEFMFQAAQHQQLWHAARHGQQQLAQAALEVLAANPGPRADGSAPSPGGPAGAAFMAARRLAAGPAASAPLQPQPHRLPAMVLPGLPLPSVPLTAPLSSAPGAPSSTSLSGGMPGPGSPFQPYQPVPLRAVGAAAWPLLGLPLPDGPLPGAALGGLPPLMAQQQQQAAADLAATIALFQQQQQVASLGRALPLSLAAAGLGQQQQAASLGLNRPNRSKPSSGSEPVLTDKQLRAREAQHRFRARQKERRQSMKAAAARTSDDLAAERASNGELTRRHVVYSRLMEVKEEHLAALQAYREASPPRGLTIPPALEELAAEISEAGVYTVEALLSYSPADHRTHMGPDGVAREAPPFAKVCEDLTAIVKSLRGILAASHECGGSPAAQGRSAAGRGRASQASNQRAAIASASAQPAPGGSPSEEEEVKAEPVQLTVGGKRLAGAAPEDRDGDDLWTELVLALDDSDSASSSHTLSATLLNGLRIEDGPATFHFTPERLRDLVATSKRLGLLVWQQGLLFPGNLLRLLAARIDTGQSDCAELGELEHWRKMLRELRLRPAQLQELVSLHSQYFAAVRAARLKREESVRSLREAPARPSPTCLYTDSEASLDLAGLAAALVGTVNAEHVALLKLCYGMYQALDFPLQRTRLFVISYPFFPQFVSLGCAASMELGLDAASLAAGAPEDGSPPEVAGAGLLCPFQGGQPGGEASYATSGVALASASADVEEMEVDGS